jgi:hypothetical protein
MYNKQATNSFGKGFQTPKAQVNLQSSPMSRNRRNTVAVLSKSKTLENFDKDLPTPNSGSQGVNF